MAVISLINEKIAELDDEIARFSNSLESAVETREKWFTDYFYKLLDTYSSEEPKIYLNDNLQIFFASHPSLENIAENGSMLLKEISNSETDITYRKATVDKRFLKLNGIQMRDILLVLRKLGEMVSGLMSISNNYKHIKLLREQQDLYKVLANQYLTEQSTLDSTLKELSDRLLRIEKITGVVGGSTKKHTRTRARVHSKRHQRPKTQKHY